MNYCFVHKIWHDTPVCPKDPLKEIKLDEKGEYKDENRIQKQIAWIQILVSALFALGTTIITIGLAIMSLYSSLPISNPANFNSVFRSIEAIGILVICGAVAISYFRLRTL
jgi:hypothetical protein